MEHLGLLRMEVTDNRATVKAEDMARTPTADLRALRAVLVATAVWEGATARKPWVRMLAETPFSETPQRELLSNNHHLKSKAKIQATAILAAVSRAVLILQRCPAAMVPV